MRRTTIRLDDQLLADAKSLAAGTNRTLTKVIEDALREVVARRPVSPSRRVELPTSGGGGLLPGVDLDDSAAIWELMEDRARS